MASQTDLDELLALQLAMQSDPDDAFAVPPGFGEAESHSSTESSAQDGGPALVGNDGDVVTSSSSAPDRNTRVNHNREVQMQTDYEIAVALNHLEQSGAEALPPLPPLGDGQPGSSTVNDPPTYSEAVDVSQESLTRPSIPSSSLREPSSFAAPHAQTDVDDALAQALDDDDDIFDMTNGAISSNGRGELAIFKRYNSQGIKTRPTTRKLLSQLSRPVQALRQHVGDSKLHVQSNTIFRDAQIRPSFLKHSNPRASLLKSAPSPNLPGHDQSGSLLLTLLNEDTLFEILSHLFFPDAFNLAFTCRTLSQHMAPSMPGIKKAYIANLARINASLAKKHRVAFCSVCCYLLDEESLLSGGKDIDAATGLRRCAQCRDLVRGKEKLRSREAGELDEDDEEEYSLLPVWRTSTRQWEGNLWYRDTVLGGERSQWREPEVAE